MFAGAVGVAGPPFPTRPCRTLSSAPTLAMVDPSALMDTDSTALECASGSVCTGLPLSFSHTQIMPWLSPDTTRVPCGTAENKRSVRVSTTQGPKRSPFKPKLPLHSRAVNLEAV